MKKSYEKLAHCMARAQRGEALTVGFLGGSITQGSLASAEEKTYAYQVYRWWCERFPRSAFRYVNGGIGGTTSHFGVARAVDDVLQYDPDVVILDFSVNDAAELFFQETYEGLLRKVLGWQSSPAVLILNNVFYDTGENAQEYHNALADYYQIPYVSMRDTLYQKIQKGEIKREAISPDGLHPNDMGHAMVARELIGRLEEIFKLSKEQDVIRPLPQVLPDAITANTYERARRLYAKNCTPELCGFYVDAEEKKEPWNFFRNGWMGAKKGDRMTLEVEASCIAVQYRKTICKPAAIARLIMDGDPGKMWILDGNFEEDWGDCLFLQTLLHHGEQGKHRIEIEIIEAGEGASPFYLLSFIVA